MAKKKDTNKKLVTILLEEEQTAYLKGLYQTTGNSYAKLINGAISCAMDHGYEESVKPYEPESIKKARKALAAWEARGGKTSEKKTSGDVVNIVPDRLIRKRGRPKKLDTAACL